MFVRVKKVGPYQYLQIAQNRREGKRVKQSIIATLGRLDKLTESGAIDQLLRSAARFPGYLGTKVGFDACRPFPHTPKYDRAAYDEVDLGTHEIDIPAIRAESGSAG